MNKFRIKFPLYLDVPNDVYAVSDELAACRARCAELEKALRLFDKFAWTAVRADCNEAMLELNRRLTTARAVLAKNNRTTL